MRARGSGCRRPLFTPGAVKIFAAVGDVDGAGATLRRLARFSLVAGAHEK